MKTKKNTIWTNQWSVPLLNEWPRTMEETMTTAKKFIEFSGLIVLFSLQFNLTNSTQIVNGSNYSHKDKETTVTNCSMVLVLVSVSLRRNTLVARLCLEKHSFR